MAKFEVEDDEDLDQTAERIAIMEAEDKRRDLRKAIRAAAPILNTLPFEALSCAEYAIKCCNDGKPYEVIPFPGDPDNLGAAYAGWPIDVTALFVVEMLHLEKFVNGGA